MPRLNKFQQKSLQLVVEGTRQLSRDCRGSPQLEYAFHINEAALAFKHIVDARLTDALSDERLVDIYRFLLKEFAAIRDPDERVLGAQRSKLDVKMELLLEFLTQRDNKGPATDAGFGLFKRIDKRYADVKIRMKYQRIDVLIVTAVRVEYLAMLRQCVDYFLEGTDFPLAQGGPQPSWVIGAMRSGKKYAKVAVILCSTYGPIGAATSVADFVNIHRPRHVVVGGIAASLDDELRFGMGDLGYSTSIRDVGLTKHVEDRGAIAEVQVAGVPNWTRLSEEDRQRLLHGSLPYIRFDDHDTSAKRLIVFGVLDKRDIPLLQGCFADGDDWLAVENLHRKSRLSAETVDLETNAAIYQCSSDVLWAVKAVLDADTWRSRIMVAKPSDPPATPLGEVNTRVVEVKAISGNSVIRQHGMRELLRTRIPNHWMLEMEGGAVAHACNSHKIPIPVIVKAVCDFATPKKEKSWQPHCADVAAAFCRELAFELL